MSVSSEQKIVHVVVAILKNEKQEVLLSRRMSDAHLGGLLEFPGGKVEQNESPVSALQREIKEELNIDVVHSTPLIQIPYSYSDRKILLDAYLIDEYSGNVVGHEGQEIFWKSIGELNHNEFPAANFGVIRALQLPKIFPVTPNYSVNPEKFLINFEKVISGASIEIVQLRSHDLNTSDYMSLAKQCTDLCIKHGVKLILNRDVAGIDTSLVAGLHLTSDKLLSTKKIPQNRNYWVGASCHNAKEIEHANELKLDYLFLGPVIEKNSSDNSAKLNWDGFAALSKNSLIPVYAIGGLSGADLEASIRFGGQGFAAIREFWSKNA